MASREATKRRAPRSLRSMGSALLRSAAASGLGSLLIAPFAIVLVAPEVPLDHRIDDVVRRAVDEPGVVFKQLLHGLLDLHLEGYDLRRLLNQWHCGSPLVYWAPKSIPGRMKNHRRESLPAGTGPASRVVWAAENQKIRGAPARFDDFSDAGFLFGVRRSSAIAELPVAAGCGSR